MTLSCEDAPGTSVVYSGNWYNEWGGECLTSPKQYVGEVVKTVGLVATPQTSSKISMILLQWMMWCIFYVGFIGDPLSILLCKHDCRIVKSTHQQHVEPSKSIQFSMRSI